MAKHPARRGNPAPQAASSPSQTGTRQVLQSAEWKGPLPPPASLEAFDRIIPGSADRILKMAEAEQRHRIAAESQLIEGEVNASRRGQYLGFGVAALAVVGAVAAAWFGAHWSVSVALVSVPVLGIVTAIVNGRRVDRGGRD